MKHRVLAVFAGAFLILFVSQFSRRLIAEETKQVTADLKEFNIWWDDLHGDDPGASRAVILFFRKGEATVRFLRDKLPPLFLEEQQCMELLENLGSDDEKVWKPARETLDYLDPRLAIDLETLMAEITNPLSRTRMVEICSDRKLDSLEGKEVSIRSVGEGYNFFDGHGSWWAEHRIEFIGSSLWRAKRTWTRAARCVSILEQIGTSEAVKVLEQLANGHPEAFPTRAAEQSLARLRK